MIVDRDKGRKIGIFEGKERKRRFLIKFYLDKIEIIIFQYERKWNLICINKIGIMIFR